MTGLTQPCHQELAKLVSVGPDGRLLEKPHTILGVIFAVAAAPDIPLPEVWFPWIFKQSVRLDEVKDLAAIHAVVISCFQWQLQQMRDEQIALLKDLEYSTQNTSALAQWMQGVLLAHTQLDSVWHHAWQAMLDSKHAEVGKLQKDLKHCLSVFSTFADIPFALQQARDKEQLATSLPLIYRSLPEVLRTYVATSGQLIEYLPNQFETFVKD